MDLVLATKSLPELEIEREALKGRIHGEALGSSSFTALSIELGTIIAEINRLKYIKIQAPAGSLTTWAGKQHEIKVLVDRAEKLDLYGFEAIYVIKDQYDSLSRVAELDMRIYHLGQRKANASEYFATIAERTQLTNQRLEATIYRAAEFDPLLTQFKEYVENAERSLTAPRQGHQ